MDCLPATGSTGVDPVIGIIALVLLGLGAAAVVIARRRKGAAIVAALPLLLGVLIFGGLASAPSAQAACETAPPPPAACVANPALEAVVTEDYTWEFTRDVVNEEFYDFYSIELSDDDAFALLGFLEAPSGTATLVFPSGDGAEVTVTLTQEEWFVIQNDSGGYYLYVFASVLEEGQQFLSRDFVYTASTPGFCDSTFTVVGTPPVE